MADKEQPEEKPLKEGLAREIVVIHKHYVQYIGETPAKALGKIIGIIPEETVAADCFDARCICNCDCPPGHEFVLSDESLRSYIVAIENNVRTMNARVGDLEKIVKSYKEK
jgi:hypothetical protein